MYRTRPPVARIPGPDNTPSRYADMCIVRPPCPKAGSRPPYDGSHTLESTNRRLEEDQPARSVIVALPPKPRAKRRRGSEIRAHPPSSPPLSLHERCSRARPAPQSTFSCNGLAEEQRIPTARPAQATQPPAAPTTPRATALPTRQPYPTTPASVPELAAGATSRIVSMASASPSCLDHAPPAADTTPDVDSDPRNGIGRKQPCGARRTTRLSSVPSAAHPPKTGAKSPPTGRAPPAGAPSPPQPCPCPPWPS